jgi:Uma2 family endonuclease
MADMDSALTTPLEPIVPTFPVKRFTADQYIEMIRAEILTEEDKVELIDGIITPMAPAGNEHTWEVHLLDQALLPARETHLVFVQGTVRIGKLNVFDPDITVVRRLGSEQRSRHPQAEDTELVIEVAKTSIKKDQTRKAAAYAEAGIPEYWIADINSKAMIVHRDPSTTGYRSIESFGVDQTVTPLAFPNIAVRVGDIFGV